MTDSIRTPKKIVEEIQNVKELLESMTSKDRFMLENYEIMPLLIELGAAQYTKMTGERVI